MDLKERFYLLLSKYTTVEKESIFQNSMFKSEFEAQARRNINKKLEQL